LNLNSYAKLNLYLEVIGRRRDNYHNIRTLFERIDLGDKISLKLRQDRKIRVICQGKFKVPSGSSNFAYRSAKLLQEKFSVKKGVDIKIKKSIPVASGLGGGSSNAAVVLIGLNKLWGLSLERKDLAGLAAKLGSDTAFFIYDCPFAIGEWRGEKISCLPALNKMRLWHLLIIPKMRVSTASIYAKWDKFRESFKLTRPRHNVKILLHGLKNADHGLIGKALFNSLQEVTFKTHPFLKQAQKELIKLGLEAILMSGSGPAIFAILRSRKEAKALFKRIKQKKKSWQIFIARTI